VFLEKNLQHDVVVEEI